MATEETPKGSVEELGKLIKGIKIAMITTQESGGSLRSRPMGTMDVDFNGDLWFFTNDEAHKVDDVKHNPNVNIAYSDVDDNRYVSVLGKGEVVKDRAKMEELWNPAFKIWFKDGLDDPHIALLKIKVESAEYWQSSTNAIGRAIGFVTAYVTGDDRNLGENKVVEL